MFFLFQYLSLNFKMQRWNSCVNSDHYIFNGDHSKEKNLGHKITTQTLTAFSVFWDPSILSPDAEILVPSKKLLQGFV